MANPSASVRTAEDRPVLVPILNNLGPMGIPLPAVTKPNPDGKGLPLIVEGASTLILPHGMSFVKATDLERAKRQDNFRLHFKQKIRGSKAEEWKDIAVGSKVLVEHPAVDAASPLGKLPEPEAIEFLADVVDPAVLGMLADVEKRPTVIRAILAQKKVIEEKGVKALEDVPDRVTLEASE